MKLPQTLLHFIRTRFITEKQEPDSFVQSYPMAKIRLGKQLLEGFVIGTPLEDRPEMIEITREEAIAAYNIHMRLEAIDEILADLDN